jgi:hypothetical protein
MKLFSGSYRIESIGRLGHHLQVGLRMKQCSDTLPEQGVIVS